MKIVLLILGLVFAIAAFFYYRWNRVERVRTETQYGPFVIRADASTGMTFNMNYGMVHYTSVGYSIWHEGRPVSFPDALESNTGLPFLWKVYALEGTPEPTLIAGSQSLFLVKFKEGKPVVEPLFSQFSDFATLQFLDSEDGQPGPEITVFSANSVDGMDRIDTLRGGQLLLVCGTSVLDIHSGEQWAFSSSGRSLDNYSFPNPPGVLALSPDKNCIVFNGSFQTWNSNDTNYIEHAMVVFDFKKNQGYTVPYDDTETRLTDVQDINWNWFNTYFEWTKDAAGQARLQLRHHDQLPYWLGKFNPSDNYYHLYPVKASMHDVFLEFVLGQMGWTKANIIKDEFHEYTGRQMTLADDDTKLDIGFTDDAISFSKHIYLPYNGNDTKYPALVKKIADAFDAELAKGRWQEHFGRIERERY